MKFDVLHPFDAASGIRGKEPCPVAVGHLCQSLFDALDIHAHGVYRTGHENRLCGHKVPCMGDPVAGQHFQPGAAHTHEIDPFRPGILGSLNQCRIID